MILAAAIAVIAVTAALPATSRAQKPAAAPAPAPAPPPPSHCVDGTTAAMAQQPPCSGHGGVKPASAQSPRDPNVAAPAASDTHRTHPPATKTSKAAQAPGPPDAHQVNGDHAATQSTAAARQPATTTGGKSAMAAGPPGHPRAGGIVEPSDTHGKAAEPDKGKPGGIIAPTDSQLKAKPPRTG